MPKTIHFEGIPGAGKTTATKQLYHILQKNPIDVVWWLEEAADHPIMPKARRAQASNPDFSTICLAAWQSYLASESAELVLLDGYAFQSTVRFMFEQRVSMKRIASYFERWQELVQDSLIVYLIVENPVAHYDLVMQERGNEWREKLHAWTEDTPYGRAAGLQGQSGFVEFWASYQSLCLELLDSASLKVLHLDARSAGDDELEALVAGVMAQP